MKKMKILFITVVTTALTFASCSKSTLEELNDNDPNAIKFASTTTRASINNLSSLEGATTGFTVYGISAGTTSSWYPDIDGTNNYRYSSGAWGWTGIQAQWPTTSAGYPMNFYAFYPTNASGLTLSASPSPLTINGQVVIPNDISTQSDIIAAKATANAKPFDGTLPLTFTHILSKVNMGIIGGDGVTFYVQRAGLNQVFNSNTYDFVSGAWQSSLSGNGVYNYFPTTETPFTATGDENTAIPFYTLPHSNHMMLMPQTGDQWVPAPNTTPDLGKNYIDMVYRLKSANDEIGYSDATKYLTDNQGYSDVSGWGQSPNDYTGINSGAKAYGNQPLFIKVGFPLNATWVAGKGYTYNILLGTAGASNGYYLSPNYFDKHGQDTGIPIGKKPGEPVADGTIHFNIVVTDWDNQTPNTLN